MVSIKLILCLHGFCLTSNTIRLDSLLSSMHKTMPSHLNLLSLMIRSKFSIFGNVTSLFPTSFFHDILVVEPVMYRPILTAIRHNQDLISDRRELSKMYGTRSLKVIQTGTIRKLGYGFLFVVYTNYDRIFSRL